MILETRAVPPFFKNGYVVGCEETREGGRHRSRRRGRRSCSRQSTAHQLPSRYILLTHAHLDHITGVGRAKAALGVPVGLHRDDNFLYEGVVQQGKMFGFAVEPQPPVDFFYEAGRTAATSAATRSWVHHTPGHCPGGVCLAVGARESRRANACSSATRCSPARSAAPICPAGTLATLLRSIRTCCSAFPDETSVYSGHGEPTTIGREKRTNPFLNREPVNRRTGNRRRDHRNGS